MVSRYSSIQCRNFWWPRRKCRAGETMMKRGSVLQRRLYNGPAIEGRSGGIANGIPFLGVMPKSSRRVKAEMLAKLSMEDGVSGLGDLGRFRQQHFEIGNLNKVTWGAATGMLSDVPRVLQTGTAFPANLTMENMVVVDFSPVRLCHPSKGTSSPAGLNVDKQNSLLLAEPPEHGAEVEDCTSKHEPAAAENHEGSIKSFRPDNIATTSFHAKAILERASTAHIPASFETDESTISTSYKSLDTIGTGLAAVNKPLSQLNKIEHAVDSGSLLLSTAASITGTVLEVVEQPSLNSDMSDNQLRKSPGIVGSKPNDKRARKKAEKVNATRPLQKAKKAKDLDSAVEVIAAAIASSIEPTASSTNQASIQVDRNAFREHSLTETASLKECVSRTFLAPKFPPGEVESSHTQFGRTRDARVMLLLALKTKQSPSAIGDNTTSKSASIFDLSIATSKNVGASTFPEVAEDIRRFLFQVDTEELVLPILEVTSRVVIHKIATYFNLSSKSIGDSSRDRRHLDYKQMVLTKTDDTMKLVGTAFADLKSQTYRHFPSQPKSVVHEPVDEKVAQTQLHKPLAGGRPCLERQSAPVTGNEDADNSSMQVLLDQNVRPNKHGVSETHIGELSMGATQQSHTQSNLSVDLEETADIKPELESTEFSQKIHVLGTGMLGTFIAHSLAGGDAATRVTLLMHRPLLMQQWHREGACLKVIVNGKVDSRSNFDIESCATFGADAPDMKYPRFGKNLEHTAKPPASVIEHLVVTTDGPLTIPALKTISNRLGPHSTICLFHGGLGLVEEINASLFNDPATRPSYILGETSHDLKPTGRNFAIVQRKTGSMLVTAIPRENENSKGSVRIINSDWTPGVKYLLRTLSQVPELGVSGLSTWDFFKSHLEKLAITSVVGPLSVMFDCTNDKLLFNFRVQEIMSQLITEISRVVVALPELKNVANVDKLFGEKRLNTLVIAMIKKTGSNRSAMLQDVLDGKRTDIDYYNGFLSLRAKELGISCPINNMVVDMVKGKQSMKYKELTGFIPFVN